MLTFGGGINLPHLLLLSSGEGHRMELSLPRMTIHCRVIPLTSDGQFPVPFNWRLNDGSLRFQTPNLANFIPTSSKSTARPPSYVIGFPGMAFKVGSRCQTFLAELLVSPSS